MAQDALGRQEQLVKDIGVRFAAIVEHAVGVMEVISRTNELPRDVLGALVKPESMSDEVFHLHCDAMRPEKDVPFYLKAERGRVDLAHRIAGDRSNAPARIAELVVRKLDLPKREYPIIDAKVVENK